MTPEATELWVKEIMEANTFEGVTRSYLAATNSLARVEAERDLARQQVEKLREALEASEGFYKAVKSSGFDVFYAPGDDWEAGSSDPHDFLQDMGLNDGQEAEVGTGIYYTAKYKAVADPENHDDMDYEEINSPWDKFSKAMQALASVEWKL